MKTDHSRAGKKDALVFVTHILTGRILDRFRRISRGFENHGDAFLVFSGEKDKSVQDAAGQLGTRLLTVDEDDLNGLGYIPIEETIIPGSNHFITMWFFLRFPGYRNYWNVEYDVDYSGEWETFFNTHSPRKSDFMACHVMTVEEDPGWYWWYTFKSRTADIPHGRLIRSFNPVYRISRDALSALDAYLKEGNEGHHEVLIPTFLNFAGFRISDFGGDGNFVEEGFAGSAYTCRGPMYSMRFRPAIDPQREEIIPDKLYHPIK